MDGWIEWNPFTAFLAVGASVGVSADVDLGFVHARPTLEVGVDIAVWWCPQFGGRWSVSLWFVHFDGAFGSAWSGGKTSWDQFKRGVPNPLQFTPKKSEVPEVGTVGTYKPKTDDGEVTPAGDAKDAERPWCASQDGFTFRVQSKVPAREVKVCWGSHIAYRTQSPHQVNIRSTGQRDVPSTLELLFAEAPRSSGPAVVPQADFYDEWTCVPILSRLPFADWGDPDVEKPSDAKARDLVDDQLTGLEVTVPAPQAHCAAGKKDQAGQGQDRPLRARATDVEAEVIHPYDDPPAERPAGMPLTAGASPQGARAGRGPEVARTISREIASAAVQQRRGRLFQWLLTAGRAPAANDDLDRYAKGVLQTLTDDPLLVPAG